MQVHHFTYNGLKYFFAVVDGVATSASADPEDAHQALAALVKKVIMDRHWRVLFSARKQAHVEQKTRAIGPEWVDEDHRSDYVIVRVSDNDVIAFSKPDWKVLHRFKSLDHAISGPLEKSTPKGPVPT